MNLQVKNWPLRWQITLWSVLITGLALATFGTVVAFILYSEQIEVIDSQLATDARFAFAAREEQGAKDSGNLAWLEALKSDPSLRGFVLVRTADGAVLEANRSGLRSFAKPWPERRRFTRRAAGRLLRFGAFSQDDLRLLLATPVEPAEESVGDLLGSYLLAFPLVILVAAGGSWWIARRALVPITAITQAAASITADRLGERLPLPAADDEIGRHIRVLNGMFDRLQRGFEQANRFTADAAHELRTPLTIMRGQIEEALRSGKFSAEQQRLLVGLLEENSGLQKISDNLLLLARFDTGKSPFERALVDLSELLAGLREDAELLAAGRRIAVEARIASGVIVAGDPVMLRRLALNLVDNAVKFNREAGRVRLELQREGGDAVLRVSNTGEGIPAERRSALFQRFYRADLGRNRDSGGSGLGLSLCREIAAAHRGTIELSRAEPDLTEFTVRLPPAAEPGEKKPPGP